jgi:hypothetical protein
MSIKDKILSVFSGGVPVQASGVTVLKKKIGDEVLVSVDLQGMGQAELAGFNMMYPSSVLAPVLKIGSTVQCDVINGNLWGSFETDLIANAIKDDQSLETYVAVSKVVKFGDPPAQDGRVCTVKFTCKAHGTGSIVLTDRNFGYYDGNGSLVDYESDCADAGFDMQSPDIIPGRVLCVIVVE